MGTSDDGTPDAVLLRVVAAVPGWATALPAVPAGHRVSVTVSSLQLVGARDLLEDRGYRFVGVHPSPLLPPGIDVADLVVPSALPHEHPWWWQQAAACADRQFSLGMGPVLRVLADLIAAHLGAWEPAPPRDDVAALG